MCIVSDSPDLATTMIFQAARRPRGLPCWMALARDPVPDAPPLVAIHGIRRGARQQAVLFARRANAMGRHVIAPLFDLDSWGGYQQAVLRGRADLALLDLLDDLLRQRVFRSDSIDLFGFSGGAQFAHRFAMLHPDGIARLSIAAPGWYTFFDDAPYPYGLSPRSGAQDPWAPSLIQNLERCLALPMNVCVGEKDKFPDKNTRRGFEIDAQQGLHRLARAERWTSAARTAARALGVQSDITLTILNGCGHDFASCMTLGGLADIVLPAAPAQTDAPAQRRTRQVTRGAALAGAAQ